MIIDLYGDTGLLFNTIGAGFVEGHLQNKLKFDVVEKDKVGAKFKEAVKKAYNAKYLDDADMVIRFAEPVQSQPEQNAEEPPPENAGAEEPPAEEQPPAEPPAEEPKDEEKPEENAGAEKEEKPEEKPEEKEQAPEEKPEDEKKEEKKDDKKEKVNESSNSSSATGTDLKKKIIDTVKRCLFQEDESKIELSDLQGFIDGYNVSFIKVSLKEKEESIEPAQ
jgi:outer membrane biosynthesis protein TonB